MRGMVRILGLAALSAAAAGGATAQVEGPAVASPASFPAVARGLDPYADPPAYPSTYRELQAPPTAIINAVILTAAGPRIDGGTVLMREGRIEAVGRDFAVPTDARIIDAAGRWVTPGIIDPHAHIGAGSSPGAAGGDSSNESGPNPGGVWVEHSVWPQDPMFERALAAGVVTMQILPGSSNMFNGRTVVLRNVEALSPQAMKFPDARQGLKMACGENPSSGGAGKPGTRAGAMMGYRNTFIAAAAYAARWDAYRRKTEAGERADPPGRDLTLETVAGALKGDIPVHIHCYRADEMLQMIDLSHEFGFRIAAFHHALEAFKIAPELVREGVPVVTWAGDWSGYKMEAYDSIMENAAFIEAAGGVAALHSDDVMLMQHLNHEAGRAMTAGREAGLQTTPEQAIRWITLNPARVLGLDDRTGSLEPGKIADVIVWSADPFSVYSAPDLVFMDGAQVHDRAASAAAPRSDFELGHVRRPDVAEAPR